VTPPTRATLLASPLRALVDLWLVPECPPGRLHRTKVPVRMMARTRPGLLLGDYLHRMRCRDCGERPVRVEVTDDPAAGTHGSGTGAAPRVVVWP
jgi:hypothetical protein